VQAFQLEKFGEAISTEIAFSFLRWFLARSPQALKRG